MYPLPLFLRKAEGGLLCLRGICTPGSFRGKKGGRRPFGRRGICTPISFCGKRRWYAPEKLGSPPDVCCRKRLLLRFPKISAACALKFLTAAPYPARFFRHRRRFTGYAHQGDALDKGVLNEFYTIRAKQSRGRSTGQRLPPPRTDLSTICHKTVLAPRYVLGFCGQHPLEGVWGWGAKRKGSCRLGILKSAVGLNDSS